MDFSNAYPNMNHEFCEAVVLASQLPEGLIRFLLWTMKAPYLYSVVGGYVPNLQHEPGSGTRQDALSLAFFSMVSSLVVYFLMSGVPGVVVRMYTGNGLVIENLDFARTGLER